MHRALALLPLLLAVGGCDVGTEATLPVRRIVGADLRFIDTAGGPALDVWPETTVVDRIPAPPCGGPTADCSPGVTTNRVVAERTTLVADRAVTVGGAAVPAGDDLLGVIGGVARHQLAVYAYSVASLPVGEVQLPPGTTRLTASWTTDDGLTFTSTASARR